jgi:5-methyltetrahydrofolate--homocysteine methyltransferase
MNIRIRRRGIMSDTPVIERNSRMAGNRFLERLQAGGVLVSDGATGTNLQFRGLDFGEAPEAWIFTQPDKIKQLHRDFIDAGANIILTDTFGGTSLRVVHSDLPADAAEVNRRAVGLAREAAGNDPVLVAGSMGPTGALLEPLGPLPPGEAASAFAEQARALADAGADLLVIETQFDLGEATAAVKGARATTTLPIVCSFSFDMGLRTMMGHKPEDVAAQLTALGVDVIGVNCGRSLPENLENLKAMVAATDRPIWMKPNAGLPRMGPDHRAVYDVGPEQMGEQAALWVAAGARIIGGCCGTSPEHLREIARAAAPVRQA